MKLTFAFVFCALISIAFSALFIGDYSDKDHPEKCNYHGRILDPGTHQSPTECVRLSCRENGFVQRATCGVKSMENCTPGDLVDKTVDYPQCCLQYFDCDGIIKTF